MKYLYLSILLFLVSSCYKDETGGIPGGQRAVAFELTENEESNISTVDVLAFRVDELDNTKEYFAYRAKGTNIVENGAPNKKKFTVDLLSGGGNEYRFVVLTNARKEIDDLGNINTLAIKAEVLKRLTILNESKWVVDINDPDYKDIPMWAETSQIRILSSTQTISGINLVRMLARIDVSVDVATQSVFKLKSVRIYNANTYGYIAPLTDAEHWDGNNVIKPSIPTSSERPSSAILYDQMSIPNVAILKGIYLFEAEAVGSDQRSSATCLVVGGDYDNSGVETFYRLDFTNQSTTDLKFLDLLRNHLYNVKISQVNNAGFNTPEMAYYSQPVNINADITVWENGGLSDVVFDGQYVLRIGQSEFIFPKEQRTVLNRDNRLMLFTDHPDGWYIDKKIDGEGEDATWLSTDRFMGEANETSEMLLLTPENATETNRTAYIHIRAGRMEYVVTVTQTTQSELWINITDNEDNNTRELLFQSHVGGSVATKNFKVNWAPKANDITVDVSNVLLFKPFDFNGGGMTVSNGTISGANGTYEYSIQPNPFTEGEIIDDPFLEKISKVNFTITDKGRVKSKNLILRQVHYNALPAKETYYLMDGLVKSFTIKANAPWKIEVTNDPFNVVQELITTSGGHNRDKSEEQVYFNIIDDLTNLLIINTEIGFTIKSTNPNYPFADIPVTLRCISKLPKYEMNCNSITVGGVYWENIATNGSNYIELELTVDPDAIGSYYSIYTNIVDGIGFKGEGLIEYTNQIIRLYANGTPASTFEKEITLFSNSVTSSATCTAKIPIVIPRKRLLTIGSDPNGFGYNLSGTAASNKLITTATNFGTLQTSTFKTEGFTIINGGVNPTDAQMLGWLITNPVDIVIMGYDYANITTNIANYFVQYLSSKGVVIAFQDRTDAAVSANFLRAILGAGITVSYNSTGGGSIYQFPTLDDEVLMGPFGDIRGLQWGEDASLTVRVSGVGAGVVDALSGDRDFSTPGSTGTAGYMTAFKHKTLNLIWAGDGGVVSNNGGTDVTICPFRLNASYYPIPKPNYGRGSVKHSVYNSVFAANTMAWALKQAELKRVSSTKKKK